MAKESHSKYKHLTDEEISILNELIRNKSITRDELPPTNGNGYIAFDSMGPLRDSVVDKLYAGVSEQLRIFSDTLMRYNLTFVLATNGPDKEGEEVLKELSNKKVKAYAITECGGILIHYDNQNGDFTKEEMVTQNHLTSLNTLEEILKQNELMRFFLDDKNQDGNGTPIRTKYSTNIVITLPPDFEILCKRIEGYNIQNPEDFLRGYIPSITKENYILKLLHYSEEHFNNALNSSGLNEEIKPPLIKGSNRRIYIIPKNLENGDNLNKLTGVKYGSEKLSSNGYVFPLYELENSLYVADNLIDRTVSEGATVLGASERSMAKGNDQKCRLGINITMENTLPNSQQVEDVKILNIGTGLKALEAIDFLYGRLYK